MIDLRADAQIQSAALLAATLVRSATADFVQYRTLAGVRRKPKIGFFGELTVEQARDIAKEWLAEVRAGADPSSSRIAARAAPAIAEFIKRFMNDYAIVHNKPRTVKDKQGYIDPALCSIWRKSGCSGPRDLTRHFHRGVKGDLGGVGCFICI